MKEKTLLKLAGGALLLLLGGIAIAMTQDKKENKNEDCPWPKNGHWSDGTKVNEGGGIYSWENSLKKMDECMKWEGNKKL